MSYELVLSLPESDFSDIGAAVTHVRDGLRDSPQWQGDLPTFERAERVDDEYPRTVPENTTGGTDL